MSYEVTLNGSLISAGLELATAVGIALEQSARDYPRRLIRVHGIDGETVLAEIRDGELVSLVPGVRVASVYRPEEEGEVIEATEEHKALLAHLPKEMHSKVACVRWDETPRDAEVVLWTSLLDLRVEGYIEPVAV